MPLASSTHLLNDALLGVSYFIQMKNKTPPHPTALLYCDHTHRTFVPLLDRRDATPYPTPHNTAPSWLSEQELSTVQKEPKLVPRGPGASEFQHGKLMRAGDRWPPYYLTYQC